MNSKIEEKTKAELWRREMIELFQEASRHEKFVAEIGFSNKDAQKARFQSANRYAAITEMLSNSSFDTISQGEAEIEKVRRRFKHNK